MNYSALIDLFFFSAKEKYFIYCLPKTLDLLAEVLHHGYQQTLSVNVIPSLFLPLRIINTTKRQ